MRNEERLRIADFGLRIGRRPTAKRNWVHRRNKEFQPRETHLRILSVIRAIPRGRVLSYGDVARLAGLPGRARLVGYVLRTCPLAEGVPWHRVVNASGRIAVRSIADMRRQRELLLREGITVTPSGRLDIGRLRWGVKNKRFAGTELGSRGAKRPRG